MNPTHHLTVTAGNLYIPLTDETRGPDALPEAKEMPLLCVYPEGDCDVCVWPFTKDDHKERLIAALFDEGNMGYLQPGKVYLPDGRLFGEIVPCGFNTAYAVKCGPEYAEMSPDIEGMINAACEVKQESWSSYICYFLSLSDAQAFAAEIGSSVD